MFGFNVGIIMFFYFDLVLLISLTLFFSPLFICFFLPMLCSIPFYPQPKTRSPSLRHIRSARSQTLPGRFTNQSPQTLPVRPRLTSDLTNSGNRGTNSKQQQQQRARRHTFSGNPLGPQSGPFKARTLHASNSLTIDPSQMHN